MKVSFGQVTDDGRGHWVVEVTRTEDDGTQATGTHVFPYDAMEWRAAEYGIDPTEVNTLLDVVLAEPYLTVEDWETGSQLHDAETIDQARADHLARCARAKLRVRMSTRVADNPLHRVRAESPMHPEALDLKRKLVHRGREDHARLRQAARHDPHEARLSALRHALHNRSH